MGTKKKSRPYLKRLVIVLLISSAFVLAFNEITYYFSKDSNDRAPEAVEIVIPAGTAQKVAQGEPVIAIPDDLTFVVGDVLEVVNQDTSDHQLGPLVIPAGRTASLALDIPEKQSYSCSFQSTQYLSLDVRAATTIGDRIIAFTLGVPTLAALLFLYSLAAMPIDGKGALLKPKGDFADSQAHDQATMAEMESNRSA